MRQALLALALCGSLQSALAAEPACMVIDHETVRCVGGGIYNYSFSVTNLASFDVGHLAFVDVPGAVVFTPPLVTFSNALVSGTATTVTVLISNVVPTNLCFRVTAHTVDFAACCVITNCLFLNATGVDGTALTIQREAPNIRLCWPVTCSDYELVAAESLWSPPVWLPVNAPVVLMGGTNCVLLPIDQSRRYFRLRRL